VVGTGNALRSVPNGKYSALAKEIALVGVERITLSVGPSMITLDSTGIVISAPKIDSVASGIHEIKGLPVKINC
jgi:hypothetical protein